MVNYLQRLTTKERMKRLYNREKIDRIPILPCAVLCSGNLAGMDAEEYFYNHEKSFEVQKLAADLFGYDGSPGFNLPGYISMDFGGKLEIENKRYIVEPKIIEYPIKNEFDAENLVLPNLADAQGFKNRLDFYKVAVKNSGGASIFAGSPLEVVGNLVDINILMRWFYKKPELVHKLQKLAVNYILSCADYYIKEFGVEKCSAFSCYPLESNTLMSAKLFREFGLPYIIEVHEKLLEKGIRSFGIHLCGDHKKNIKYFKEIQLPKRSFIHVSEKMDIEAVAKEFGTDYIIGGNVPTAILRNGTADEVYNESVKIINKMKYFEGGFVLMPSCDLPPETPPLNLYAMVKAVNEFGVY